MFNEPLRPPDAKRLIRSILKRWICLVCSTARNRESGKTGDVHFWIVPIFSEAEQLKKQSVKMANGDTKSIPAK